MHIKRSFNIAGMRTSIALEREFWEALETLASDRDHTMTALITKIDAGRDPAEGESLASTLRVFALLNRE